MRQKFVVSLVVTAALVLMIAVPAAGLGFSGELWMITSEDVTAETTIGQMYRGDLQIISIGPLSMESELLVGGDSEQLRQFFLLLSQELEISDLEDLDGETFLLGEVGARIAAEAGLFDKVFGLGSIGWRASGFVLKETGEDAELGLYQGLVYSAGLGYRVGLGLSLFGEYFLSPQMEQVYPSNGGESATWSRLNVGFRYRIPLIRIEGGYRLQKMESGLNPYTVSGVFLNAGIRF